MKAQGAALGNEIHSGIPASTRRPQWSRTDGLRPPRWGWMIRLPGLRPGLIYGRPVGPWNAERSNPAIGQSQMRD